MALMTHNNSIEAPAGGADWEIGAAAEKLSKALGVGDKQADALRAAMADHAAAVGSKSTQMIAGLFGPLMQKLDETRGDIGTIALQVATLDKRQIEADAAATKWRADLRTELHARFDQVWAAVDGHDQAIEHLAGEMTATQRTIARHERMLETVTPEGHDSTMALLHTVLDRLGSVETQLRRTRRQVWIILATVAAIVLLFAIALIIGGSR